MDQEAPLAWQARLSWLGIVQQSESLYVQFLVRAHDQGTCLGCNFSMDGVGGGEAGGRA